jgi:hypothetical protein
LRVLVIDAEYLVALEAEQVLVDALHLPVDIVMPRDCVQGIRQRNHQVIIVDAELVLADRFGIAEALTSSDALMIFWSFDQEHLGGLPQWPGVPVIHKPLDGEILVDLVRPVAEQTRQLMEDDT